MTAAWTIPGRVIITPEISPGSTRWPFMFTIQSLRSRYNRFPSSRRLPMSPVRTIVSYPSRSLNGLGTNVLAVASGRLRYPSEKCPVRQISPSSASFPFSSRM